MHDRTFHLWDLAKQLVNTVFNLFGEPQQVAARGAVDRKCYIWLIAWLYACETLLRRLLLIEAKTLNVAPASSRPTVPANKAPAVRAPQAFSLNPDDWRVSFHLLDRRRLAGGTRATAKPSAGETPAVQEGAGAPIRSYPALPLAFRMEALYRVCKNPLPYVRRLARFIARIPQAVARILAPPRERKRRSGDPPNPIPIIGHEPWREIELLELNTS